VDDIIPWRILQARTEEADEEKQETPIPQDTIRSGHQETGNTKGKIAGGITWITIFFLKSALVCSRLLEPMAPPLLSVGELEATKRDQTPARPRQCEVLRVSSRPRECVVTVLPL
jgi:hypothetical protein